MSNMTLPEYSNDLDALLRIKADVDAVGDGADLFVGIWALRSGEVAYAENKTAPGTFGWKGVSKFASKVEWNKGLVSKVVAVVNGRLKEALSCPESEIQGRVLAFIAEAGSDSVNVAYTEIKAAESEGKDGGEPKAYNAVAAFQTVCTRLKNDGKTREDVREAFYVALKAAGLSG